jgi:hypothetical protein
MLGDRKELIAGTGNYESYTSDISEWPEFQSKGSVCSSHIKVGGGKGFETGRSLSKYETIVLTRAMESF